MAFCRTAMRLPTVTLKSLQWQKTSGILCNVLYKNYHTTGQRHAAKLYSKEHEWIEVNDNIGKVGISAYAKEKLGDIVFVQLPEIGAEVEREGECGAIESVKAASDVYSPASGEIVEVNSEVESNCDIINRSPEDEGWLYKMKLTNFEEDAKELMNKEAYDAFILDEDS